MVLRAEFDRADFDFVVDSNDCDTVDALDFLHSSLGNENCVVQSFRLNAHLGVLTGADDVIGIAKLGLEREGAGAGINLAFDRGESAGIRVLLAVGESDADVRPGILRVGFFGDALAVFEIFALGDGEAHPERIHGGDGREWSGLAGADEAANLSDGDAREAVDRRINFCVVQIDFGGVNVCAGHSDSGSRSVFAGVRVIELLATNCVFGGERGVASDVVFGLLELGFRLSKLSIGLRESRDVRAWIDGVKNLTRVYDGAVLIVLGLEETRYTRENLDFLGTASLADSFKVNGEIALYGRGDNHFRRGKWASGLLRATPS